MKKLEDDPPMVADLIKAWGLADELCHIINGKMWRYGALLTEVIVGDSAYTLRAHIESAIDMVRKIAREVKA